MSKNNAYLLLMLFLMGMAISGVFKIENQDIKELSLIIMLCTLYISSAILKGSK